MPENYKSLKDKVAGINEEIKVYEKSVNMEYPTNRKNLNKSRESLLTKLKKFSLID